MQMTRKRASLTFKRAVVPVAALLVSAWLVTGCSESASAAGFVFEADRRESPQGRPGSERPRSLADLLDVPDAAASWVPELPRLAVDDARAAAAGIRKLSGRRLVLYTDLVADEEVDVLPAVFDQAFPQWCDYFGVEESKHPDWRMTALLMKDKARFKRAGLLPDELPPFEHGFSRNYDMWLYEQPSAYYRRHLLLHEGTHGFMNTLFGACGPPWYMEGLAELIATHRWRDGRLRLNHMPANREEVPMWGRIKIVRDCFAEGRARRLGSILEFRPPAFAENEPYAWCWAAAALLDGDPRYRQRFRQLHKFVLQPDLSDRFRRLIGEDWEALAEQWQVFVADLEYGYDVPKTAVDLAPGGPLLPGGGTVTVAADRGWQNSGLRLEAQTTYRLRAEGRYQVADRPQVWWCEPGGVSIRYYRGRPLGILLAAVRREGAPPQTPSALLRPITVGLETTLTPKRPGTLFLRVNDSAGELGDNAGSLTVHVKAELATD